MNVCWVGVEYFFYCVVLGYYYIVLFQGLWQCQVKDVFDFVIQQFGVVQFVQNVQYVVGVMYIFYMVFLCVWCYFIQLWYFVGEFIDIVYGEVDFSFLCCCQQVQNGIGGVVYGDIQCYSVFKGCFVGDIVWQCGSVILFVIVFGQFYDMFFGVQEQFFMIGVGCQQRVVVWL